MSDWTVELEFEEGISNKFWRARIEGRTLHISYGKVGSEGQTQVKDFASPQLATTEYDRLVAEKRKKGYRDADDVDADEVNDDREPDDEDDEDVAPVAPRVRPVRLVLESGGRKVETYLICDSHSVRVDSSETYAGPDAAKRAYERIKQQLLAEGYKEK